VTKELGLDEVQANALLTDQADIIRPLQSQGRKSPMAGDGLNDAPARRPRSRRVRHEGC
jgi:cation transport ATPase